MTAIPFLTLAPKPTVISYDTIIANLIASTSVLPPEQQPQFAKKYLESLPERIRRGLIDELAATRFAIKWDPRREPKPTVYVIQEAARKVMEGGNKRKSMIKNPSNPYESKLVSEEELVQYLNMGWDFVANVNGKIAVRRKKSEGV